MTVKIETIIKNYDLLKSLNEMLNMFSEEFDNDIENFCKNNDIKMDREEIENRISNDEIQLEESSSDFEITENMKSVMKYEYREITKITHPDKTGSNPFTDKIFKDVSEAYEEKNIFEIIKISNNFLLKDNFDLSEEEKSYMLKYLKDSISEIKRDKVWNWSHQDERRKTGKILNTLKALKLI